jgi:hypothetical protein
MHTMFEVYLAPGSFGELLTEETARDTMAQVMTKEEAEQVGFAGLPDGPEGVEQRFIVVAKSDERRILNALEANPLVAKFALHEVNI